MLLRLLDQLSESSDRIETKRTMFAVSALCRQHPEGLSEFVAHRGFETLKHIMWSTTLDVQASIVRFIGDIAGEHSGDAYTSDDTHGDNYDDHTYNPKLLRSLANNGWCNLVALLFEKVDQRPSLQEDVLNTLLVLNPVCAPETIKIRHHLTHTAKTLMGLYEADRENEYAKEIANLATRTVAEAEYIANQTTLQ